MRSERPCDFQGLGRAPAVVRDLTKPSAIAHPQFKAEDLLFVIQTVAAMDAGRSMGCLGARGVLPGRCLLHGGRILILLLQLGFLQWHREHSALLQKNRRNKGSECRHRSPQSSEQARDRSCNCSPSPAERWGATGEILIREGAETCKDKNFRNRVLMAGVVKKQNTISSK